MRRVFLGLCLSSAVFGHAMAANYTLDPSHTYPSFTINHLGFSTLHGRFNSTEGRLVLDQAAKQASVEITISAASIDTGFDKRDEHLRSPDFLNVAEFPKITFKSTKVSFNGDKPAQIDGELTMLGVTKPVSLTVTSAVCGPHPFNKKDMCGFDATAQIKRSDFGINYGLPAIGDDLHLSFEVEATKD